VISTKARREEFAQDQLARRSKPVVAPLFPGYLFVHIDLEDQFSHVVWTPGVRKFIGFGELPYPMDDVAIDFLQARVGHEGILRALPVFKQGDLVRIKRGPLEGLVGIIENPGCGHGRVRVLMELLRRQTRVEVPQQIIERVSA